MLGYARVSTRGQDLALQLEALQGAGCERIYHEQESGARSDRPALGRLLKRVGPGDVVTVTRLDRLARSSRDLQNIVYAIGLAGGQFRSLGPTAGPIPRRHTVGSCSSSSVVWPSSSVS